jgi:hypothetical protein
VVESLESVVPVAIDNAPVPNPVLFPTRTVPAPKVTPPVNVFAPLSVSTDAPAFVNENAPPIAPLNTTTLGVVTVEFAVNAPTPPRVSSPVFVPSPSVTAPPNEYPFVIVRAVVESLERVPPVIINVPVPNPALFPTLTVPDPIVTPPVNVFVPLNVSTPVPPCTNEPPVPLITPL